jgi:patatin-like phospholipase/acyl hydrolase
MMEKEYDIEQFNYGVLTNFTDGVLTKTFTERIAMKDLFNMTAGTSTGSIIAAGLAYPHP